MTFNELPIGIQQDLLKEKCILRISNLYEKCDYSKRLYFKIKVNINSAKFLNYYGKCGTNITKGLCGKAEHKELASYFRHTELFDKYQSRLEFFGSDRDYGTGTKGRTEVLYYDKKGNVVEYIVGSYTDFSQVYFSSAWSGDIRVL